MREAFSRFVHEVLPFMAFGLLIYIAAALGAILDHLRNIDRNLVIFSHEVHDFLKSIKEAVNKDHS